GHCQLSSNREQIVIRHSRESGNPESSQVDQASDFPSLSYPDCHIPEIRKDFPGNRGFQKAPDPLRLRMPKPYYSDFVGCAPGKYCAGSITPIGNKRYMNPALIVSVVPQYCGCL